MITNALNKLVDVLASMRDVHKQTLRELKKQTALMSLSLEYTIAQTHDGEMKPQEIVDIVKAEVTKRAYEKD